MTAFSDIVPCTPVEVQRSLLSPSLGLVALKMEAASTSETSVNFYQTTRRNIPEDIHLRTSRRENLKSHLFQADYSALFIRDGQHAKQIKTRT
jgi:hypothetical protein